MTLTKRDIVNRISDISALSRPQVFQVVQQTLDSIAEALAQGDRVELRDFGVFEVKHRKPRVGRNPKRPETDVPIPARSIVKFKVGRELRARVLRLPVEPPRAPDGFPKVANFSISCVTDRRFGCPSVNPVIPAALQACGAEVHG